MSLQVDIEKRIGKIHLKVAFETNEGTLALLGASGCGKSMTLKCIAGIEKPDKGRIVLDGRVLFDSEQGINLPAQKRRIGYLFQNYALFPNMTVVQNIKAGLGNKENAKVKIASMLKLMGLEGLENKKPKELSGGEAQRVALARIIINEPQALLLDEPFSALDAHLRFRLEGELRKIIADFGKNVILVSHDRDEVFRMSDSIAVMDAGKIDAFGKKNEIFSKPNTLNGAILTGCKNFSKIEVKEDGRVKALDWGSYIKTEGDLEGIKYIGIRMHDIHRIMEPDLFEDRAATLLRCRVRELVENPFSCTVMLEVLNDNDEAPKKLIGWQVSKEKWKETQSEIIYVSLPVKSLLLLKE